jgi:hypothetical protein
MCAVVQVQLGCANQGFVEETVTGVQMWTKSWTLLRGLQAQHIHEVNVHDVRIVWLWKDVPATHFIVLSQSTTMTRIIPMTPDTRAGVLASAPRQWEKVWAIESDYQGARWHLYSLEFDFVDRDPRLWLVRECWKTSCTVWRDPIKVSVHTTVP